MLKNIDSIIREDRGRIYTVEQRLLELCSAAKRGGIFRSSSLIEASVNDDVANQLSGGLVEHVFKRNIVVVYSIRFASHFKLDCTFSYWSNISH